MEKDDTANKEALIAPTPPPKAKGPETQPLKRSLHNGSTAAAAQIYGTNDSR